MKLPTIFSAAALSMILGVTVPVHAQQDEPHLQEENRAKPDDKPMHEQDKQAHPADKEDKHANKDKQDDKHADHSTKHEEVEKPTHTSERHEDEHSGRIPDDRFRANFGREHRFRVGHPVIVEGAPRFRYGGYWFVIVQPWPVGWAYEDEVYVDYLDGGYFLFNPVHPGVRISINVVF